MASYLITGTSRGLGLTLTTLLADRPKSQVKIVIAAARKQSPALETLINKHSGRVVFVPLEVTSAQSVEAAVQALEGTLGEDGLDVLINVRL
jgi:NAD(P)-dependent dehydrogenase (short-subunit alcohol dehydrogenase family)